MIFSALSEAADRGELLLVEGGLCRFHRRRDGVVKIRELVVLPDWRRLGIGRALVDRVAALNPGRLLAAGCPVGYEANAFWPRVGFVLSETIGEVNWWHRRP